MDTNSNMYLILSVITVVALLVAIFGGGSHKKHEAEHKPQKHA